jgi:hypothetical protein
MESSQLPIAAPSFGSPWLVRAERWRLTRGLTLGNGLLAAFVLITAVMAVHAAGPAALAAAAAVGVLTLLATDGHCRAPCFCRARPRRPAKADPAS